MRFFLTGGNRGIGAVMARTIALAGHDICFTYRSDAAAANDLCAAITAQAPTVRVLTLPLDVRDPDAVTAIGGQAEEALGGIDAVVCNAATNAVAPVPLMQDADWHTVIDTNLTGSFLVARHFVTGFLARRRGRLIFISSIASAGMSGQAAYAASKAGLIGLSGTLARECGPRKVTSNIVTLGLIDAGMGRDIATKTLRDFWTTQCPARRLGLAEEAAQAVLYLASDAAGFVNGQDLRLTGGLDQAP